MAEMTIEELEAMRDEIEAMPPGAERAARLSELRRELEWAVATADAALLAARQNVHRAKRAAVAQRMGRARPS